MCAFKAWLLAGLLTPAILVGSSERDSCSSNVVQRLEGDIYVNVFLPLHRGVNCERASESGEELSEAVRWTVARLNNQNYLRNTTLGALFFDSCRRHASPKRMLVEAIVSGGLVNPGGCNSSPKSAAFVVADPKYSDDVKFLEELSVPFAFVPEAKMNPHIDALLAFLMRMNWTRVVVVGTSEKILQEMRIMSSNLELCVTTSISAFSKGADQDKTFALQKSEAVILIGASEHLLAFIADSQLINKTNKIVFLPSDNFRHHDLVELMPEKEIYIVHRINKRLPEFLRHFVALDLIDRDLSNSSSSLPVKVEGIQVFEIVKSIYGVANLLHLNLEACLHNPLCLQELTEWNHVTRPKMEDIRRYLNINPEPPRFNILSLDSRIPKIKKIGFYYAGILSLNEELDVSSKSEDDQGGQCIKMPLGIFEDFIWREGNWIVILSTTSTIGSMIVIVLSAFILIYTCRPSSMEGPQGFLFLLMFSVLLLYSSLLPFCFEALPIVCALRPFWSGVAYGLTFSCLLSRSLMIATSDTEGSIGHVSGLVQTSLIFFMSSVQVGIGVTQWIYNIATNSEEEEIYCDVDYYFLYYFSYIKLLLLLQIIIAPFTLKSRRNQGEGVYYFTVTVFVTAIWITWVTLFIVLGDGWREFVICSSNVATATSLLAIVIFPKTYLMVSEKIPVLPPVPSSIHSKQSLDPNSMGFFNSGINYVVPFNPNFVNDFPETILERERELYGDEVSRNIYFNPSPNKVTNI